MRFRTKPQQESSQLWLLLKASPSANTADFGSRSSVAFRLQVVVRKQQRIERDARAQCVAVAQCAGAADADVLGAGVFAAGALAASLTQVPFAAVHSLWVFVVSMLPSASLQ